MSDVDPHGLLEAAGIVRPPATPELDKQHAAIADGAHRIGEFLDWLGAQDVHLATRRGGKLIPYAHQGGFSGLIAGFYQIDLDVIERERRALLEHVRKINGIS